MTKTYIYFTKCTESYKDVFKDKLFEVISAKRRESYSGFNVNDKKVAYLHFDNTLKLHYQEVETTSIVILFHDSLDLKDIGLKGELLKSIETADKVFVFHHNSNSNNISEFKTTIRENKLTSKVFDIPSNSNEKGFSHIENDKTNPFYRLSELWNCSSKQEFDDKLYSFEGFLKTEEKLKQQALKELKHSVFNDYLEKGDGAIFNNKQIELLKKHNFELEKDKLLPNASIEDVLTEIKDRLNI